MINYLDLQDTIAAVATAPGLGAIAVIRISGTESINIASRLFKGKNLLAVASHTAHLGYICDENGRPVDQVLVTVFIGPNSYTREHVVEISCHGSPYIQQQLMELFMRNGARMARQGEFTLRAFLNGQLDLAQAEAVADLIASDSAASHELAMKQIRGGFSNEIKKLREELIHFASLIELELDFGEEDVEFANRKDLQDLVERILGIIRKLMDSFQLGNVLRNGVSTVIAGRPNAGKSTLLNTLLNEERAIVSEIAGTTRDTIEENLNINGVLFRLIDTAGIREAGDQIEAMGVQKTFEKIAQSTILVYVYDVIRTSPEEVEKDLSQLCKEGLSVLVIANKIDEIQEQNPLIANKIAMEIPLAHFQISAKYKDNIDAFKKALYNLVLDGNISTESTVVTNLRHYQALNGAYESLSSVLNGLSLHITGDFLAMDIRHALRYLGEITGTVDVEDLLENIFSKFCIGK
jgi:tRNA modification GTPase